MLTVLYHRRAWNILISDRSTPHASLLCIPIQHTSLPSSQSSLLRPKGQRCSCNHVTHDSPSARSPAPHCPPADTYTYTSLRGRASVSRDHVSPGQTLPRHLLGVHHQLPPHLHAAHPGARRCGRAGCGSLPRGAGLSGSAATSSRGRPRCRASRAGRPSSCCRSMIGTGCSGPA